MKLDNYFDLLIDEKLDSKTNCPICVDGVSEEIQRIYLEIKQAYKGNEFQKSLIPRCSKGIYYWKQGLYPVPIYRIKQLLTLWQEICNKSDEESLAFYNQIFDKSTYFRAKCCPTRVKIIKELTPHLAYLIGNLYSDGSLRDIWLTLQNKKRFVYEITITDEFTVNLQLICDIFSDILGVKTNVKGVYGGRWYRILFSNMIIHRMFNKIFNMPMGYKKNRLRVPELIYKSDFEIKKNFLIGFFDGDGACNKTREGKFTPIVSVSQSSKGILEDLDQILREGGLFFNIYKKFRDKYEWYTLETKDKKNIRKFKETFGFYHPIKKERLDSLVKSFNVKAARSSGSQASEVNNQI